MSEQNVFVTRRNYNRWVANQTLEDYALRYTANSARHWSMAKVANTALGAISFLALEAIGGAITLHYGFDNAIAAIMVVTLLIFLTGLPISYYAVRYGVDIDLLTRGAGFGYIGSTITSLIYASFTFIFFAIEAAIMASALELLFAIPKSIGYLVSALAVIPLVTHGITFISRFQLWTQPLWVVLQLTPFVFILYQEWVSVDNWINYSVPTSADGGGLNILFFGAASGVLFSLIAQIGEQVDFLRFLPKPGSQQRGRWWLAIVMAGPGWIVVGAFKILAGSFLAVLAVSHGVPQMLASDPIHMYLVAFGFISESPTAALALAGIFVVICQLKINVTNAYAGSIAWSNFFSRLTHSHPGRVVWLVFNVIIALMLMELGVYEALENILGIYSNVAVAWVGALVADLVINKPLGLSPKHIEFKRAHLYDVNPVGAGAMLIASVMGVGCYMGAMGELAQALSPYLALVTAFVVSPIIAAVTKGQYYIARPVPESIPQSGSVTCMICENIFEVEDMTSCPAYDGAICSLCCSLDARCNDQCKVGARFSDQLTRFVTFILPKTISSSMNPRLLQFSGLLILIAALIATLFWLVFIQMPVIDTYISEAVATALLRIFLLLMIVVGILTWLFVLANESRQFALNESFRQTSLLRKEIAAHEETDHALQEAKQVAEDANQAKSRYLIGISHELRSPLNSVLGYAQLLEKDDSLSTPQHNKVRLIRRSGEHLADLIEGLLDISRIEAGRLELRRDHVSLPDLMNDLTDMFRYQAQAKGIDFRYIVNSSLPSLVVTDVKHLRQMLINLLSNAIKYTQQGGVSLAVRYRNQVAEFTISDTGIGIEENDLDKIFLPFERIRKPGQPQSHGTGLGLTITRFLTEIMGGELTVQSEPGRGSIFKLSLLLSSVTQSSVKQNEPVRRIEGYEGDTKTIMVVDDEAAHRGLISEILSPLGFVVLESSDAQSCLDVLDQTQIDLFLLDISMPGLDGWQLARKIREQDTGVPIVMVSANALETSEQDRRDTDELCLNDDYLIKPIRDTLLIEKVAAVLDIEWRYQSELQNKTEPQLDAECMDLLKLRHSTACRELIEMAELGYVEGIVKVLEQLEQTVDAKCCVILFRHYLEHYQFHSIIAVCRQVLT